MSEKKKIDKIQINSEIGLQKLYGVIHVAEIEFLQKTEIRIPDNEEDLKNFSEQERIDYERYKKDCKKISERSQEAYDALSNLVQKRAFERQFPQEKNQKPIIIYKEKESKPEKKNSKPVKYRMSDEYKITTEGRVAYRIYANYSFGDVEKGDAGGFIEYPENLDPYDNSWVYNNAVVCEWARVSGNAKIIGGEVRGNAQVCENAKIIDSYIYDKGIVKGSATVKDSAVADKSVVMGKAYLDGNSGAYGTSKIGGEVSFYHTLKFEGNYGGREQWIEGGKLTNDLVAGKDYDVLPDDPQYGINR